jgi:TatD DNase family protein
LTAYTDTHCHLDFERFDPDRGEVIHRAWEAGLVKILNPGIDVETSDEAIRLSAEYPGQIFAAVGVHPNYGQDWMEDTLAALREQTQDANVVAIGEIGLDYYREYTPHDIQRTIFREQLNLAAEVNLPVIIHNREATRDLMGILTEWTGELRSTGHPLAERPGVLHSYSDDLETAQQGLAMNFYLGIGGPVTFKNALDRKEVVREIPLECILLETDAPYLTPHPHRGQRNEPAYIPLIAAEIAALQTTSPEEVAQITTENANHLFHWN